MSPSTVGIIGILLMLTIFVTRMPVAYVMTLVGVGGFSYLISINAGLNLLPRVFFDTFSSYELTTIPLFVLMGQLAFNSGISRRLYNTTYTFLGNTRGGLAMATVSACTAFGAVCGSSPATAATMATVGIPEMKRFNYSNELAAGSVASGGGLGMIMPPSVVLIVYGILTEQSIGALFVSGILPAFLMTILFIISIYITCRINPETGPKGERFTWNQKIRSLAGLIDTVLIFVVVMAGLFAGFFTPTESAAVGVLAVLLVSILRRQLSWKAFVKSLHETLQTSCMILFMIAGAMVFGKFLAVTRIPFDLATWISGFDLPPFLIISIIILIYFLGGCFMDSLGLIMLTIPIFFPIITNLGYDPIWFGVIIVLVTEMGVITPPVGLNVYVVYGVAKNVMEDITLESIFKGIVPFLGHLRGYVVGKPVGGQVLGIHLEERRLQPAADGRGHVGRARLELVGDLVEGRVAQVHRADHVATAHEGRHLLQQLAPGPEGAGAGRRQHLVAAEGIEVRTQVLHVDGQVGHSLGAVDEHEGAGVVGLLDHGLDVVQRAQGV